MTDPIKNRFFETPDASGTPGEAEDWTWTSSQALGAWAEFNTALVEYLRDREDFAAGWDDCEDWIADLSDIIITVTLFNEGGGVYESTYESFELWGDGVDVWPPWYDGEPAMIAPHEVVSPPAPASAVGWDSWYATLFGGVLAPLPVEGFEESWDNDPFSTSGAYQWWPGIARNGTFYGKPLDFPVTIEPNKTKLHLVRGAPLTIYTVELTTGQYADSTALVAELNTQLGVAMGVTPHSLGFTSYTDAETGKDGVRFGWDQLTTGSDGFVLAAAPGDDYWNDARQTLGFASFDPRASYNQVTLPVSILAAPPVGADPDDVWWMDSWSFVVFRPYYDYYAWGGWGVIEYNLDPALFGGPFLPSWTLAEMFYIARWAGGDWVSDITGFVVPAMFNDYAPYTPTTTESFEEAWDEEPFPF